MQVWVCSDSLTTEEDPPKVRMKCKERTFFNSMKLMASWCYLVALFHEIDE